MPINRLIGTVLISALLQGCVTLEGMSFSEPGIMAMPPGQFVTQSESVASRVAVIGTTSALRAFDDKDYDHLYALYVDYFAMPPVRDLTVTIDELKDRYVGYTRLKVTSSLGYGSYGTAMVPRNLDGVEYADAVGVVFFQSTEDLVAAATNEDGLLELTSVLCHRDRDYSACAEQYRCGVYDARTGREVTGKNGTLNPSGARIDPETFKVLHE